MINKVSFWSLCLLVAYNGKAQNKDSLPKLVTDHSYKPMILKLDEKGAKFIRFITWHQVWFTSTANNPGTLDINGKPVKSSTDIGLRRSRFLVQAQVSPRFMILAHWGINNQNFISGGSGGSLGFGASGSRHPACSFLARFFAPATTLLY